MERVINDIVREIAEAEDELGQTCSCEFCNCNNQVEEQVPCEPCDSDCYAKRGQ
jgi:hypothetical protein